MQRLERYNDDEINEEKAVAMFLRVVPKKYSQLAISIETLLDLSALSIKELAGEYHQSKRGQAHVVQAVEEEEELALFLAHGTIELLPRTHISLGDGTSDDKIDSLFLDSGASHHMTGRREYFSDLNVDVRGSVKFGDSSAVEINGIGSVILIAKTGEHWLLTSVYYIPAQRNSIISLGQLDENGSHVGIDSKVLRIWD
ncbi:uncharacterized protein [Setaria viridis]|uniref:uncharacterized protein n=1 Tax=Setaria viridis TaxID=4556 RepID=UPI0014933673|nr:uncharacterized protein LOC117859317 [Setaria viridis]